MLTKLEVRNRQGDLLSLPLTGIEDSLIVDNIEGLEPVKATLVSSSFAQLDGAQYHSSRREARNIKLKLGIEPDWETETVRDVRNRLYNFFMPKTPASLRFFVDTGDGVLDDFVVDISARIESFDSALFVKDPEANISFMCFDPDFYNPEPVILSGMSTSGLTEVSYEYPGTVETGLLITVSPDRALSEFTIYHRPPDGTLRMLDFSSPLLSGDVLSINTSVGNKSVIRSRGGYETSLLYAMSPQSNWLEFQPGENRIRVYAEGDPVPFSIEYTTKYGGL